MSPISRKATKALKTAVKAALPKRLLLELRHRKAVKSGEPELRLASCVCSPAETSIDVGANLGLYSCAFAKYSNRVIAVEANPFLLDHLKQSLPGSVKIFNIAASNQDGECEFFIPMSGSRDIDSRGSLEADVNDGFATRKIQIKRQRLDELPLGDLPVSVIKIDVEGHELGALEGSTGILERFKPTIIVESEARHHSEAPYSVFSLLYPFGYEGYFVHRGHLRPVAEFSVETLQTRTGARTIAGEKSRDYINNFIFVHPSHRATLDKIARVYPFASAAPS